MPIVEAWESTVKNASADRNAGATMRKKMKITMAATSAPTSGRASRRLDRPRLTRFDDSAGADGGVDGGVVWAVLLIMSSDVWSTGVAGEQLPATPAGG